MAPVETERIVALDLRPQSLGFAVFEGEGKLLDWGARSFPGGSNAVRVPPTPKIRMLIAEYLPDALVLKQPRAGTHEMLRKLKQVARTEHVAVLLISSLALHNAFPDCHNKDEIASAIGARIPELSWIVPPRRKIWENEDYRLKIFDAAATGIAYFACKRQPAHSPEADHEPFQRPLG